MIHHPKHENSEIHLPGNRLSSIPALAWMCAAAWLAALLVFCLRQVGSFPDIAWHLAVGRRILATRSFIRLDPFTYVSGPVPYVDVHWLFQVSMAAIYGIAGWGGLVIARTVLIAGGFALLLWNAGFVRRAGMSAWWMLLLLLVAMEYRFFMRPEAVTFFLFCLFLSVLWFISPRHPRALWWLIPAQVVWANCQGLFVLGPALAGFTLAGEALECGWRASRRGKYPGSSPSSAGGVADEHGGSAASAKAERAERRRRERRERRARRSAGGARGAYGVFWRHRGATLAKLIVILPLASFLNPYGIKGVLFPLELLSRVVGKSSVYRSVIAEFLPPLAGGIVSPFFQVIFCLAIAATALTFVFRGGRRGWMRNLLLYAIFLFLGLNAVRNAILFLFVALAAAADNLRHPVAPAWLSALFPGGGTRCGGRHSRPYWTHFPPLAAPRQFLPAAVFALVCLLLAASAATNRYYMFFDRRERTGLSANPYGNPGAAVLERLRKLPAGVRIFNGLDFGGFLYDDPSMDGRFFIDGRLEVNTERSFYQYFEVLRSLEDFQSAQRQWGFEAALFSIRVQNETAVATRLARGEDWVLVEASSRAMLFVTRPLAQKLGWNRITPEEFLDRLRADGLDFADSGDRARAIRPWWRSPLDPALPFGAGAVAYAAGWMSMAEDFFRNALERDPSYVLAWRSLVATLATQGYMDQALRAAQAGLRRYPKRFDLLEVVARALMQKGDRAGAEALMKNMEETFSDHPDFWMLRLQYAQLTGNQSDAQMAIRRLEAMGVHPPGTP